MDEFESLGLHLKFICKPREFDRNTLEGKINILYRSQDYNQMKGGEVRKACFNQMGPRLGRGVRGKDGLSIVRRAKPWQGPPLSGEGGKTRLPPRHSGQQSVFQVESSLLWPRPTILGQEGNRSVLGSSTPSSKLSCLTLSRWPRGTFN